MYIIRGGWYNGVAGEVLMFQRHGLKLISLILIVVAIGLIIWGTISLGKTTVVVEWSTASELDTAGFNLYRSDSQEGQYVKVNSQMIPASLDPLTGGSYAYEDSEVQPGKAYYYQLEEIENAGHITRYGPIEVKAHRGGKLALVLVGFLLLIGAAGLHRMTRTAVV